MARNTDISTKALSGFMELLPADQILFNQMKDTICQSYERFGFIPLDTPIIERSEVLLAKAGGETEKQIYRFEKGSNDLSLRFDLTVPLARYVSEHMNELTFPFRRYAVGKVFRGERPQKGRFREFYQCDIDIIGNEKLAVINDAEIPSIIYTTFKELGFDQFTIRINNRKILNGLFDSLGLADRSADILREIDKIDKIGADKVRENLTTLEVEASASDRILEFIGIKGENGDVIEKLKAMGIHHPQFKLGVEELAEVCKYIEYFGVPVSNFKLDLSIARGLDYYTGTVYETVLDEYPGIGSVCSGGRYDNLAECYTDRKLPGVGISIGLTRLFYKLTEAGIIKSETATPTRVLIYPMVEDLKAPLELAAKLRKQGINTEVYAEKVKMKKIFNYIDKLGIPFLVIVGEDELKDGNYSLKDTRAREQKKVTFQELIAAVSG